MGFENCHPAVNMIYFVAVIYGTIVFKNPVFLAISYVSAFVYSVKRNGKKAVIFDIILIPFAVMYALYYSSYTHFGVTVLEKNLIGNNITAESLLYGFITGITVITVIMWFSCIYSVFSSDKVVYLLGKISPHLSLYLSILLRIIPRIKNESKKIYTARRGIKKSNILSIISILITWTIDALILASESMRSRGSLLKGRKAFSIYRFDNRDRLYVIGMFICLTVTIMGAMLKQTYIICDPRIVMPHITPMSYVFYVGYAGLCLMPLLLELWTEWRFKKLCFVTK